MQLIQTLSVVALATSAVVAMPANVQKRQWQDGNRWWDRPWSGAEITVSGFSPEPTGGWGGDNASPAASTTTTTTVQVTATPANFAPAPQAPAPTEAAPAPQAPAPQAAAASSWAAPAASPAAGASGGQDDYMSVVSQWRAAGGLPALTQDSTLEGNAMKTSTDSTNGLEHELNPGTMAQVLAPGTPDDFESVYVGGWLCEIPTLPGLNGICATEAQGWDHSDGETGHATILTSTTYTKIGCALSSNTGVWACDLA